MLFRSATALDSEGQKLSQSDVVSFRTKRIPLQTPIIIHPLEGDTVSSASVEVMWQPQVAKGFRVELSTVETFATRQTKIRSVDGNQYSYIYEDVVPGNYFLRVRAQDEASYLNSDVVNFVVVEPTAVDFLQTKEPQVRKIVDNGQVIILKPDGKRYNMLGQLLQ